MSAKWILLAEDNPDDEVLTLRTFERYQIANRVIVAHDGAEALEVLFGAKPLDNTVRGLPQLVLLDLNLPKVDGLEVLRRIRNHERTRRLPIILLTSSMEEQELVHNYDLGASSEVRKPLDFPQLVDAIRKLSLYWLILNESPAAEALG
jgi:two-component system response regulator